MYAGEGMMVFLVRNLDLAPTDHTARTVLVA